MKRWAQRAGSISSRIGADEPDTGDAPRDELLGRLRKRGFVMDDVDSTVLGLLNAADDEMCRDT